MENKLFRQESIDRISSPEELHDYIIYSLEGVSDEETRLIAYGDILETLDEMGLLSVDDITSWAMEELLRKGKIND